CGADQMCQECEVEATSCTTNQQCTGVCAGCNTETNTCQYMCEPVEYLESAGTQYIDTGIECTNNLVVSFKGSCSTNENAACCGGIDVANAPTYFRHHWSPFENGFAYWIMYSPGNAYPNRPPYFEVNTVYEAKVDPVNGVLTVNGVDYSFPPITSSFTTGKSYGIFGRYSNSGAIQSRPSRFYYFKMWNNDTLVRDFIPVLAPKKEGTGQEPAMFDKVNNEIYYNAGTGTFKYGL
ncbi:MAG: hypothetical protein J6T55_03430, partial [Alphaproteobacteria bacterium]|nr:hypothetical protein [Alphaproteobacteria bacterium]